MRKVNDGETVKKNRGKNKIKMEIVAINIAANSPPKRRQTAMPTSYAKILQKLPISNLETFFVIDTY